MKSDAEIRRDVEAELSWVPEIDETDIAVKVTGGVVTLTGFVHSYHEKYLAESAAKRVIGVGGVANDIQVQVESGDGAADPEVARRAVAAIKSDLPLAHEGIKVLVHEGCVTLEGNVEWFYQRDRAESAARRLAGVKSVANLIAIKPRLSATDIQKKIEAAFRRSAELDAQRISVETRGSEVTLKGKVPSWMEHDEAERTAWRAPGVTQVKNEISVRA